MDLPVSGFMKMYSWLRCMPAEFGQSLLLDYPLLLEDEAGQQAEEGHPGSRKVVCSHEHPSRSQIAMS